MVRTPTESPPTKERLLDAAEELMVAKGFAATTVDDICEAAELTKGSFFHYFESKDELGKAVLERYCQRSAQRQQDSCAKEPDPLKRVYSVVDFLINQAKTCESPRGCLLGTFAQELSDTHPEIRKVCARAFGAWVEALAKDLEDAKARYAPTAPFDSKSLAEHFITVLEGAQILSKTQQDTQVIEKSLTHFKHYLKAIFGR